MLLINNQLISTQDGGEHGRSEALQVKLVNFASPSASSKARAGSQAMDTDEANASSTPEDTLSDTNNATAESPCRLPFWNLLTT